MSTGMNRNCYIKASKTDSTSKRQRRSTPRQCPPRSQPFQLTEGDMDELVGIVDGNIELDQRKHHQQ